jgi:hypothetical protein
MRRIIPGGSTTIERATGCLLLLSAACGAQRGVVASTVTPPAGAMNVFFIAVDGRS